MVSISVSEQLGPYHLRDLGCAVLFELAVPLWCFLLGGVFSIAVKQTSLPSFLGQG